MQIKWGTSSRSQASSKRRWLHRLGFAGVLVVVVSALSGCYPAAFDPIAKPVVIGLPLDVSQKVDNAQAAFVNAVGTLATNYDEAVCREESQLAGLSQERQAIAEANLEVAEAVVTAHSTATARGGGPASEEEGIIIIEEAPPVPERNRGGWTCLRARGEPSCVSAAASDVTQEVYRSHIDGYDLNPVTTGDVLEAFAADAKWADQYLVAASDRAEAFDQIRQACRDGKSPLARFFRTAVDLDHPEVRRDLMTLRDDFVGVQQDVCETLPIYYDNLIDELQSDLSRRVRLNQCTIPVWEAIWDQ